MVRLIPSLLAATLLAACGSSPQPTSVRTPTPRPTPPPTPTPAPDVDRVDIVSQGVGTYQLITVPVAVLHNAAARTGVRNLTVHFIPTSRGHPLTPLDSPAVTLYPGEVMPVTANCTDTCLNADAVTVTVVGGTWAPLPGAALSVTSATAACVSGCRGHGQWDVTATVGSPELAAGTRVDLFAACFNAAGAVVGGGQVQVFWPQAGGTLSHDLPAILSAPPASCQAGASAPI